MGMVIGPFNFEKRSQVRQTMLQSGAVRRGAVAWRFVVGLEALATSEKKDRLMREASQLDDILLLPEVLDGASVAMPCSCTEKTYAWFTFALRHWPLARWIAKTEDDTYTNLDQLLSDLSSESADFARILEAWQGYRKGAATWFGTAERAFLNAGG